MRWPWTKSMDDHEEDHEHLKSKDQEEKEEIAARIKRVQGRLKRLETVAGVQFDGRSDP